MTIMNNASSKSRYDRIRQLRKQITEQITIITTMTILIYEAEHRNILMKVG